MMFEHTLVLWCDHETCSLNIQRASDKSQDVVNAAARAGWKFQVIDGHECHFCCEECRVDAVRRSGDASGEEAFRVKIAEWDPVDPFDRHGAARTDWRVLPDRCIAIVLRPAAVEHLGDELNRWFSIGQRRNEFIGSGWKRSASKREDRREAIVYDGCYEFIEALLGRQYVLALMERIKALNGDPARKGSDRNERRENGGAG